VSIYNVFIGLDSKEDAMFYLQDIEHDKLAEIGQVLGLSFATLFSLMKSDNFLKGMIITWLEKKDQVDTPTWKSLGGVLQRMGFTKAVEKITKGIVFPCVHHVQESCSNLAATPT
jgi:uncharacterized protein with LGFP repeats